MKQAVIYIHGKGGSAAEAEHYKPLFPDRDVIGFDYQAGTPWDAKREFAAYFRALSKTYDSVWLIANSIGAFFAMQMPTGTVKRAYFISPVVDMETLIRNLMTGAGVTEETLQKKRAIALPSGEVLSWDYLCYVRENPIEWTVPTHILYGERDLLTAWETAASFAQRIGATLTVMPNGEHWFHTDEQMAFLDDWIQKSIKNGGIE